MLTRLRTLLSPPAGDDDWGYDPRFVDAAQPLLDGLYRWWRVTVTGAEHLPAGGHALIAANHAGVAPWDGAMIATAVRREIGRDLRVLGLDRAFDLPWASSVLRRAGAVPARPQNARRLLDEEHLVLVFPEAGVSSGRPFSEHHRVARFGRSGFVDVALRAGAPIVPCAVVGSAPLPSRWRIEFCAPIATSAYGPDAASDRRLMLELSDTVREQIQAKVYENLIKREGAFL